MYNSPSQFILVISKGPTVTIVNFARPDVVYTVGKPSVPELFWIYATYCNRKPLTSLTLYCTGTLRNGCLAHIPLVRRIRRFMIPAFVAFVSYVLLFRLPPSLTRRAVRG